MKIGIRVLSPIHIGSGEELTPSEYLVDREKGFFHRLNMDSLFQDEKFRPYLERFIREAAQRRAIGDIIKDHFLFQRHILYSIPVSSEARQAIFSAPANVKAFIKSGGRVYLPGSSLKGSILSAILWFVLKEHYLKWDQSHKVRLQELLSARRYDHAAFDELLKVAFPLIAPEVTYQQNPKFIHWLDLRDSSMRPPEESLQISLANVKGAKRGGEIPIYYECLKEGLTFEAEIKQGAAKFSEEEILKIAHNFFLQVAKKDGVNVPSDPYLLRVGQGSTAYSTSLLILAENLQLRKYAIRPPRTRKRIAENIPMGFARLYPM